MAQVIIRNLAPEVVGRLKARARANGRSLESELRRILEAEAGSSGGDSIGEDAAPYGRQGAGTAPSRAVRTKESGAIRFTPPGRPKFKDVKPIKLRGKPVSELLIEDRRDRLLLDPDVDHGLARIASAEGITKAEVIRRALERVVDAVPRPRLRAIGVGKGPGDVADNVDRYLAESGFGED